VRAQIGFESLSSSARTVCFRRALGFADAARESFPARRSLERLTMSSTTFFGIAESLVVLPGDPVHIMCKAMNRSFISVIMAGFAQPKARSARGTGDRDGALGIGEDAAVPPANAESVVIVPGYGLAVARASTREEMAQKPSPSWNVQLRIHPVAGACRAHERAARRAEVPLRSRCSR